MKQFKRLLCLLLALVALTGMLPRTAAAAGSAEQEELTATVTVKKKIPSQTTTKYTVVVGNKRVKLTHEKYITIKDKVYEFSHYTVGKDKFWSVAIPAYDGTKEWEKKWGNTISVVYKRHYHSYKKAHDRIFHWDTCDCGYVGKKEKHVDPALDSDKICTCDYRFSDNATLTTLWLANMNLAPAYNREITDYTGNLYTWVDVTETSITATAFDALAKVELPTNLAITEGLNTFQVKVTAEDKTTTKVYTVKAVKPVKVEEVFIAADGEALTVTPKTVIANLKANVALTEAVEQKLTEMLTTQQAAKVVFAPQFNRWNIPAAEVTLNGSLLEAIARKPAALAVTTPYGTTLTVPAAELSALAAHETVTFRVANDNTFALLSGEEVLPIAESVLLEIPQ